MKTIPLSNSTKVALIDDVDYPLVSQYKWYLKKSGWCWYVCTGKRIGKHVKTIRLHRLLCDPAPDMEVHHKNSNTLDCQRHNMLVCTKQENLRYNYV